MTSDLVHLGLTGGGLFGAPILSELILNRYLTSDVVNPAMRGKVLREDAMGTIIP